LSTALTIVLILFCIQGLVKFAVGFLVPYDTRIKRISSYYERDGRIISIYDTVTLVIIVALVILLFLVDMQELSFITGLVVGMLIIQIFLHRFDKPLNPEQAPESGSPPRKIMSFAIQADPKRCLEGNRCDDGLVRLGTIRTRPRAHRLARLPVSVPHEPRAQSPKPSSVARRVVKVGAVHPSGPTKLPGTLIANVAAHPALL